MPHWQCLMMTGLAWVPMLIPGEQVHSGGSGLGWASAGIAYAARSAPVTNKASRIRRGTDSKREHMIPPEVAVGDAFSIGGRTLDKKRICPAKERASFGRCRRLILRYWGTIVAEASGRKPLKIYQDEVKLRHTSHWDADFMSRAEFEAHMGSTRREDADRGDGSDAADRPATQDRGRADGRGRQSWWDRFMQACTGR